MSTTFTASKQSTLTVPRLQAQVNNFHSASPISQLAHGHPSSDPTVDGYYDWTNPRLTLFTRNMTPEILALNPVLILERYLPRTRNSRKSNPTNRGTSRWVIPGNSANNGLNFHGGASNTNRGGIGIPEVDNFIPITNNAIVGYNHILFDNYLLPVDRFVRNSTTGGNYGVPMTSAVYVPDWNDYVVYSQHRRNRNYYMKFRVSLAIPNPNWTATNHQNKYIFGEGQTIIVEPKLQTFDDGSGLLEYYVGWRAKVVN
jgi:hypothetical protein